MTEWKVIPNEPVVNSRGLPVKLSKLDTNYEAVFHQFHCPGMAQDGALCTEAFTNYAAFQEHMAEAHPDADTDWSINAVPLTGQADTIRLVVEILIAMGAGGASPYARVRKPQVDARHMDEVWRRIGAAQQNKAPLRLRDDQYIWLRQVLERPIPLAAKPTDRDPAEEKQTVGSQLFAGLESTVRWYLTNLPDRKAQYDDPPEDEAKAAPPPAQGG